MDIELRNINLENVSLLEQVNKVKEEDQEFLDAVRYEEEEHAIEEFWDKVQSSIGLLYKMRGITVDEVMSGYKYHLEKIKNRPRNK